MMMAGMVSSLEDWIADMETHSQPTTNLKYAKTYLCKQMDILMEPLTEGQKSEIITAVQRREVGFYVKDRR